MAYHYVDCDRDQMFLLPASMRDWLEAGRPAYNPDMMLALLFYAYGTGVRSSRRIEQLCHTDAAYRVICGHATPDHATIARFTVDHETAIERVFVDVLRLCREAGLATVATIAIDGTKMAADAALDANRSATTIRAEVARILAEARTTAEQAGGCVLALVGGTRLRQDARSLRADCCRRPVGVQRRVRGHLGPIDCDRCDRGQPRFPAQPQHVHEHPLDHE